MADNKCKNCKVKTNTFITGLCNDCYAKKLGEGNKNTAKTASTTNTEPAKKKKWLKK